MKYAHTLILNDKEINILKQAFELYEAHVNKVTNCNANKDNDPAQAAQAENYSKFWKGRELGYQAKVKSMHKVFQAMVLARSLGELAPISEATEFEGEKSNDV